ncbi:hypothetical protein ABK040_001669 [Willaertia magna]
MLSSPQIKSEQDNTFHIQQQQPSISTNHASHTYQSIHSSQQDNSNHSSLLSQHYFEAIENANLQHLYLIPIKFDIKEEENIINDNFIWNLKENYFTPEIFTSLYVNDLKLNKKVGFSQKRLLKNILDSLKQQINYYLNILNKINQILLNKIKRKQQYITINISVKLNEKFYSDKFEWDIFSNIFPEDFVKQLCNDCNLDLQFLPLIVCQMREQIFKYFEHDDDEHDLNDILESI